MDEEKELALDFNKWESTLTYRQRKLANMKCDEKFGCTVPELYEKLQAQLISKDDLLTEALEVPQDKIVDMSNWPVEQKIAYSNYLMKTEQDIIILCYDDEKLYSREELEAIDALYHKFQSEITIDRRTLSDQYSLAIWGKSVTDMYKYITAKKEIDRNKMLYDEHPILRESVIDKTLSQVIEIYKESDDLHRELMKIDALTTEEPFYESSVLQENFNNVEDNYLDYNNELPSITPFLTYNEFCDYNTGADVTPHQYVFIENGKKYYETIKAFQEFSLEEPQLKLGWNPAVPMTYENIKAARDRQVKWMNENCSKIQIIDISDLEVTQEAIFEKAVKDPNIFDTSFLLKPVYIVLSFANTVAGKVITKFKHSEYSHAGITFDTSLDNIYTYNFQPKAGINGFTKESIKDYNNKKGDVKIMVNTIFVPSEAWKKMKETLAFYEENRNNSKYGFKNLLNFVTNKAKESANSIYMVCSQFVDNMLKMANIDITGKSSNLVAPGDFERPAEGSKIFTIFKGWKKDYNKKNADNKVKALEKANSFKSLNIMEATALIEHLFAGQLLNLYSCDGDPKVEPHLINIHSMLTPTPGIIVNEFKLPVRFSDNGDLNIDLPANLQSEYEESHKLLSMYDESNMNGIKHEVARMFYLNSIIEKKLQRMKKTDKNFKVLMDLRARILNDYSTYFKIIKKAEPEFDFLNYLKGTEYWNKTVVVDGSTLKYSGAYIKKAIQLLK